MPNHWGQSLRQSGQSNFFGSMFEELRSITTQNTTNYEAIMHCPTQTSREGTPSSDKEVMSDDAVHCAQGNVKGGNKWHKKRPLGTATRTNHDDDRGWEAGSSGMGYASGTTRSSSRLVRSPT
jgi:hypothetical protein